MIETFAQSYGLQCLYRPLLALLGCYRGVVHQGQFHILHARGLGQEVIVLKDKTYLAVAQHGTLRTRHGAYRHAVEVVFATRWGVETTQLVEQGRLARSRLTHDGDKLALVDLEAHALEGMNRLVAYEEVAPYVVELNHDLLLVLAGFVFYVF